MFNKRHETTDGLGSIGGILPPEIFQKFPRQDAADTTADLPAPLQKGPSSEMLQPRPCRVLIAGLGNIGSWLSALLAPLVTFVRLVDRDRVESKNVWNQSYGPDCVGKFKVDAVADALAGRWPHCEIQRRPTDLEDLPQGDFADVELCVAGLDSLRARQVVSESCYRLGIPLIDGAVGEPLLGRVQVLLPGSACIQCQWGVGHYRQLAAETPCIPGVAAEAAATTAPAMLGAVTAGLMTSEYLRLLGQSPPAQSREIFFDLDNQRHFVSRLGQASGCRFDHQQVHHSFPLAVHFDSATVADAIEAAQVHFQSDSITFEVRRSLFPNNAFSGQRYQTPESLRKFRGMRLSESGFSARDHLLVRANGKAAFLCLDQPADPEGSQAS